MHSASCVARTCPTCGTVAEIELKPDEPIASRNCPACAARIFASRYERIDIGLTEICNLSCNMCRRPQEKATMSYELICSLMREAREIGVSTLSFSGGEPFAHPRFREILGDALALGFEVELVTNGTLVRDADAEQLARLKCVTVSIDGPRDVHDEIRGMKGAWDKSIATLGLLDRKGAKWGTNTVIQAKNADALLTTWRAIRTAGRPSYVGFTHVEVLPETTILLPDARGTAEAKRQIAKVREECLAEGIWFNDDAMMTRMYRLFADKTRRYRPVGGCPIPQTFLGISSHGIFPCWHQGRALPNDSLIDALESPLCRDIVTEARASQCIGCNAANYSWSRDWLDGIIAAADSQEWSEGVVYLSAEERRVGHLNRGRRTIPLLERQARGDSHGNRLS